MTTSQIPTPERIPTERVHHGHTFVDHYEWLRDKESPRTRAYLEAENVYTEAATAHLGPLRAAIFDEIKARTLETDMSVPVRRGNWWYFSRTVEGQQYGLSCRKPVDDDGEWLPPVVDAASGNGPAGTEEVLLDLNVLAEGHDFFSLGASSVSPNGRLLAYSTDVVGDERFSLRFRDLDTGLDLDDVIDGVSYGATWSADSQHVFYTTVDEAWRTDKVWRHKLSRPSTVASTPPEITEDVLVHHEADDRFWVSIGRTRSDRYLAIGVGSKVTSEYWLCPADAPESAFTLVAPRVQDVEYHPEHAVIDQRDVLLVMHNRQAENFALSYALPTKPYEWFGLLEHDPAVRLEDVDAFADHVVISQRSEGLTQLRILTLGWSGAEDLSGPAEASVGVLGVVSDELIEMEHPLYTVGSTGNPEFSQPVLRFGYVTMSTPAAVLQLDLRTGERSVLKTAPVLPAQTGRPFAAEDYEQYREWATASDGTLIPISVVVPAGSPRDGSVPFLLYGYGAYETSIDPYFTISRLSLLDRGVGFAIAHVRGGGEMGRGWYDQGKMLRKLNTFTDFVACGQHLIDSGWTSAHHLAAEGGSAGGLLMGAVANLAPEMFCAIVADVPFVDALTTILDPSLPLTVIEWEEWGNPLHDAETYAYMASYSPYENIEAKRYPAILAETSLNDTRVLYVEPAKWVAELRHTSLDADRILLKTEMSAGHGGVSGRYNAWHDRAFSYAWLLDQLGRG